MISIVVVYFFNREVFPGNGGYGFTFLNNDMLAKAVDLIDQTPMIDHLLN